MQAPVFGRLFSIGLKWMDAQNLFVLRRYFPNAEWTISVDTATTNIGCFILAVEHLSDGYRSSIACFSGASTVPIFRSTDIGGQSLESAIKALWLFCQEQGKLMVAAVGA